MCLAIYLRYVYSYLLGVAFADGERDADDCLNGCYDVQMG